MSDLKMPAIGEYVRNIGRLIRVDTIQPPTPAPYQEYIFEEIDARCDLRLGEEVIDKLFEYDDFYGLNTSVVSAIEDAKAYANKRKLTANSELEVVVIKVVSQYRKRKQNEPEFWGKEYYDFKTDPKRYDNKVGESVETVVWSSKHPELNEESK